MVCVPTLWVVASLQGSISLTWQGDPNPQYGITIAEPGLQMSTTMGSWETVAPAACQRGSCVLTGLQPELLYGFRLRVRYSNMASGVFVEALRVVRAAALRKAPFPLLPAALRAPLPQLGCLPPCLAPCLPPCLAPCLSPCLAPCLPPACNPPLIHSFSVLCHPTAAFSFLPLEEAVPVHAYSSAGTRANVTAEGSGADATAEGGGGARGWESAGIGLIPTHFSSNLTFFFKVGDCAPPYSDCPLPKRYSVWVRCQVSRCLFSRTSCRCLLLPGSTRCRAPPLSPEASATAALPVAFLCDGTHPFGVCGVPRSSGRRCRCVRGGVPSGSGRLARCPGQRAVSNRLRRLDPAHAAGTAPGGPPEPGDWTWARAAGGRSSCRRRHQHHVHPGCHRCVPTLLCCSSVWMVLLRFSDPSF